MSKALYRKYRSKRLSEIVGQKHVTDILARSLAEGRVAHAYLLTGPRGVGKTSIARILAHEINHLPYDDDTTHLDIIEIDAASNNGVEDIRSLRERVQVAPVMAAKKVYIIDEVHMLSKAAFNALLKTLEEPPEHAVFILATTDSDKIPATIISRTQRFSLRPSHPKDATEHLAYIAGQEGITIDSEALELIALRGDGSFRDSISLLDQLRGIVDTKEGITRQLVEDALGLAPSELVSQLLTAYEAKDLKTIVDLLDSSEQNGVQATVLASQLVQAVRALVITNPPLLVLLDDLLVVARSTQPSIKLLTVLGSHAIVVSKPRTVALASPMPTVSAPIAELVEQATRQKPTITPPTKAPIITKAQPAKELDWKQLIDYTRINFVAIYSVLSKCNHKVDGSTLTLYTGNSFYKKKLDDTKHRINLITALAAISPGEWTIETVGSQPPSKDSQVAAIAAIMGGGEEVSVD